MSNPACPPLVYECRRLSELLPLASRSDREDALHYAEGPYSRDVLCFYIGSKWFCYVNIEVFDRCCVKTSAADAEELRERYAGIRPAWHMNKRLWSDVYFGSDVPDSLIPDLVRRSYGIIKASLPLKERDRLATP